MTQTNFKNSNAITPQDLDMELEGLEIETEEENLQEWDETAVEVPEKSFFGSKAHQITRNQLVELYHKVDALNRPDEEDLLDVLNEALRDERSSKRMEKANVKDKAKEFEEQAWQGYSEVFEAVRADLESNDSEENEKVDEPQALHSKFEDDSVPSRVDEKAKTAFYEVESNVNLHGFYEDAITTHDITASGTVTLHGATQKSSFRVTYDEGQKKFIIIEEGVDAGGKAVAETYKVDGEIVSKIIFDSKKVDVSALTPDQQKKIQIGTDPTAAQENAPVSWPEGGVASFVPGGEHSGPAQQITQAMDRAASGKGDWSEVMTKINNYKGDSASGWLIKTSEGIHGIQDQELMNDVMRKVVTAVYRSSKATGKEDPRFLKVLEMIPAEVRYSMIEWVTREGGELNEKHGGDQFNSQETADVLQASFNRENKVPEATEGE